MRHLYLELLLSATTTRSARRPAATPARRTSRSRSSSTSSPTSDYKTGVRKLREDLPFPAILGRVCPRPVRGPVPAPARRAPDHHLPAAPLHGRPEPRRGADGRAAAAGRAQARQRQAHRHRRRRARRPRRRLLRPARGPRRQDLRGAAQAGRHAALRHPQLPPAARRARQGAQRAVAHGRRAASATARLGVDFQLDDLTRRATTPSSWPWAPSTATPWASPARTPTASSPRSTSSASSSSPATCTWATRSPSSAAASPPWTPAAPAVRKGADEVTCLYRRSRKEMPAHATEVDEAEEEGVQARAAVRAGARRRRRRRQGHRHRDAAHGARRARRLGPAAARCPSRAPSSSSSATR